MDRTPRQQSPAVPRARPDSTKPMMIRALALIVCSPIVSLLLQSAAGAASGARLLAGGRDRRAVADDRIDSRRTAPARASSTCASRSRATRGSRPGGSWCSVQLREREDGHRVRSREKGRTAPTVDGPARRGAGSVVAGRARGADLYRLPPEARDRPGAASGRHAGVRVHRGDAHRAGAGTVLDPIRLRATGGRARRAARDRRPARRRRDAQDAARIRPADERGERPPRLSLAVVAQAGGTKRRSRRPGPPPSATAPTCRPCGSRPSSAGRTSGAGTRSSSGRSARQTPRLRRKAEELTKGLATPLEKVEALYDYVATNFRYVSLSLGAGRYQPRAAGDVLRDEYGDCKDKHTLLASLLEAIGLHAVGRADQFGRKIDPDFPSPVAVRSRHHAAVPERAWTSGSTRRPRSRRSGC